MTHYVAIVEEEEGTAVGVWFPDLPGCFSAGDTLDEAMTNAAKAFELWAETMIESGQRIPPPLSLVALRAHPEVAEELSRDMVALIPSPLAWNSPPRNDAAVKFLVRAWHQLCACDQKNRLAYPAQAAYKNTKIER